MSLAEFALPSSEVRINRSKSLRSRNEPCLKLKTLVNQITDERRKKSSSLLGEAGVCRYYNDNSLSSLLVQENEEQNNITPGARQTVDDLFKLIHAKRSSRTESSSKTIIGKTPAKKEQKGYHRHYHSPHNNNTTSESSTSRFSLKRQRPWTAPNPHREICPTTRPSTSCSLVTPLGMDDDVKIFCVDPDMISIIENFEPIKDCDDCGRMPRSTEASEVLGSGFHFKNRSTEVLKQLNKVNFKSSFDQRNERAVVLKPKSTIIINSLKSRRKRENRHLAGTVQYQLYHQSIMQDILHNMEENRSKSYQLRDARILNAKQRRSDLRNNKLKKLEENLQRKEQKRLDHLSLKKKQDRQKLLITTMILVSTTYSRWLSTTPQIIDEYRYKKLLNDAARKIQNLWKKEMFSRKAMEATLIKKRLKPMAWRVLLWFQCTRRRLNAEIIRQIFREFASNPLPYLIFEFRRKVITAQKMMRSFLVCKHARISALEIRWGRLEKEVMAEIMTKQRRRKNSTLSQFIHRQMISKPEHYTLEERHGFANIVNDATHRTSGKEKVSLDPHLCRLICRIHLEDSRRYHMSVTGQREVKYHPVIHVDQAINLVSGKELEIKNFSIARQWPMFSLFLNEKIPLRNVIKDAYRDEAKCRKKVEMRIEKEINLNVANHFATHAPISKKSMDGNMVSDKFEVDEKTTAELRVIFQLIDLDCDDKLSSEEIEKLFFVLGSDGGHENTPVESLTNDIHFGDFIAILNSCSKKDNRYSKETVIAAFHYFEKENQGKIQGEELLNILQSYTGKWDKECAYKMMKIAGVSTSQYFNYRDFVMNLFAVWDCNGVSEILKL